MGDVNEPCQRSTLLRTKHVTIRRIMEIAKIFHQGLVVDRIHCRHCAGQAADHVSTPWSWMLCTCGKTRLDRAVFSQSILEQCSAEFVCGLLDRWIPGLLQIV